MRYEGYEVSLVHMDICRKCIIKAYCAKSAGYFLKQVQFLEDLSLQDPFERANPLKVIATLEVPRVNKYFFSKTMFKHLIVSKYMCLLLEL